MFLVNVLLTNYVIDKSQWVPEVCLLNQIKDEEKLQVAVKIPFVL